MFMSHSCCYARVELAQTGVTKQETYSMQPDCVDRYFFKPVNYHGRCLYYVILLPIDNILLEKAVDGLYRNKSLVCQIFGVNTYNKYHIENICLQLLANRILDCIVEGVGRDTDISILVVRDVVIC